MGHNMLLLLTTLLLHPVHETIAEIEWNAKTKRLEVALRLDSVDDDWIRMEVARSMRSQNPSLRETSAPPISERTTVRRRIPTRKNNQAVRESESGSSASSNWRMLYLQPRFQIGEAGGDITRSAKQSSDQNSSGSKSLRPAATYHWIGMEEDRGHVWWFFEIVPRSGRCPNILEHRILFDKESNQANRVILLGTQPTQTRIHTTRNPRQTIFDEKKNVQPK